MFNRTLDKLTSLSRKQKGDQAEQLACEYLQAQGLTLITRNYHSRLGEIDLIMNDPGRGNLVFIEVRYRKSNQFGGAALSVTPKKQQRIIKTAMIYLQQHAPDAAARFDIVAISGSHSDNQQDNTTENTINWITDAFQ